MPMTPHEARQRLFAHIAHLVTYWRDLPDVQVLAGNPNGNPTHERLTGLMFSMLVAIDGSSALPGFDLIPRDDDGEWPTESINADVELHAVMPEDLLGAPLVWGPEPNTPRPPIKLSPDEMVRDALANSRLAGLNVSAETETSARDAAHGDLTWADVEHLDASRSDPSGIEEFKHLLAADCIVVLDDRQRDVLLSALREIDAMGDIGFVLERCEDLNPGYALDWDNGGTAAQDTAVDDVMDKLARRLFLDRSAT
ncbi:hypothetical protein ASD54_08800 [Rhizobium sp. Root149]|uniref:antitoxin VbhA family protein n=1 Tax=Rhizobium sp. Root149 TaxID=1736473 RepID=UPI000712E78B|nr:antitoxin VbhA family protein [Rhizobium sp. Root149]KQZ50342.1 hypothetical protein ASD54_08800 [Rhizobium sp. Root149]